MQEARALVRDRECDLARRFRVDVPSPTRSSCMTVPDRQAKTAREWLRAVVLAFGIVEDRDAG